MGHLFKIFFKPPPMPPIEISMPARLMPGVKVLIGKAFEMAYYRGVYDGLLAGVLLTLLLLPSVRKGIRKGISHAIDYF
jgi:hypothetical protein